MTEKEFEHFLLRFTIYEPFFASIVRHMNKIRDESIGTAGVIHKNQTMNLYWSPTFISSLSEKKRFGLLKHECYHLIFNHTTSRKQEPHHFWNIATDCAINSIIPISELPECGIIPGEYKELKVKEGVTLDENKIKNIEKFKRFIASLPKGKAAEWYMKKLQEDMDISECIEDLYGQDGGIFVEMDVHDLEGMSDCEAKIFDEKIKGIVKKASERATKNNSWGTVSCEVREYIIKSTAAEFDWKRALKYFCGNRQKNSYFKTQRKLNRKYPYIHPGRKTKKTSMLAIYIDQSGSVGNESLENFGSVLEKLSSTHSFVYYTFDSEVDEDSKTTWKKGKNHSIGRTRCGGTCFTAVEEHFRKIEKQFDGYVVMTDGIAEKPPPCKSKRCWVICKGGRLNFTPDKKDYVIKMV